MHTWAFNLWDQINETLAIIVWPAVTICIALVFRDELTRLLQRITRLSIFGNEAELESQVTAAANDALASSVPTIDSDQQAPNPPATQQREPPPATTASALPRELGVLADAELAAVQEVPEAETLDRVTVEDIARTMALAGFRLGATGEYDGPPRPSFRWTEDGLLQISGWTGRKRRESAGDNPFEVRTVRRSGLKFAIGDDERREQVRRLEDEIRRLDEREHTLGLPAAKRLMYDAQRKELAEKLWRVDRNSPWAQTPTTF